VNRREFITLLGSAAAWPLAARAQQPAKLPTIGFLGPNTRSFDSQQRLPAFVERLRELGWIEGRTIAIEYRWAEGSIDRAAELAAEFVRLKVDVIVTSGTPQVLAAKQATSVIPIVFAAVGDPVGAGVVATLARPDGNATGLSLQQTETTGKRLELLREVIPGLRRLAIIANSDNLSAVLEVREAQAAARALGLDVVTAEIQRREDIAPAFEALKGRVDALYVAADPLLNTNRMPVAILAVGARLPTMYSIREPIETGGLIYYGPNFADLNRRAADFVDKILRGTKPADLPVEQPTKFDLVINLITAKALGLTIPATVLARADETARIHRAARRHGGRVAARGAGPTVREATDHWVLGRGLPFCHKPMDRRFCAATPRTRLDRGPHSHDRVSLGGRRKRARGRDRGRVRPSQGGCHSHGGNAGSRRSKTCDVDRPDSLRSGGGPSCK